MMVVVHLTAVDELGGPRRPGTWRPLGLDGDETERDGRGT